MMQRFAVIYSDGSLNILSASATIATAFAEAADANRGETDPAHLAYIARVSVTIGARIEETRDAPPDTCPRCGRARGDAGGRDR